MIPYCPNCQVEMKEETPNFEDMTEGQLANYEASHWGIFTCPKCGRTDLYEDHFEPAYEEKRGRRPHILTEKDVTTLTDNEKEVIRERDNYTCQICGARQKDLGCALDIHHILGCYGSINNPEQLISLCKTCHGKIDEITTQVMRQRNIRNLEEPEEQERLVKAVWEEISRRKETKNR